MTKYRIIKRTDCLFGRYRIQQSENKKKFEDYLTANTENSIRKKWFNLFRTSYDRQIKELNED